MRSTIYSVAFVLMLAFTSCGYESPKYKALKAQTDSITNLQQCLEKDIREYVYVFNHIGKSADKIQNNEADHIQQIKTKLKNEDNAMVNDNIAKLNFLLQANQEEIENLKKQARRNAFRAKELEKNVERVTLLLEEESMKSAVLQSEVEAKDSTLTELETALAALTIELDEAKLQLAEQAEIIAENEDELFSGYYITGSKSELKKKKVLTTSGLCKTHLFQEEVNAANFEKVNILDTNIIVLPSSVKGKILSSHPKSSYKLKKDGDNKVIEILNPEIFWSVTKYLVIQ